MPVRNRVLVTASAVVLLGGLAAYVVTKHVWAEGQLAQLEPRYARLVGIEASAAAMETALAERRALLARHAYPGTQDVARAGSDAQQRARDIFSKAGMEVSSIQVLPAKPVDGFDRIPVVLRVEGDLPALQSALTVIPAQAPSLLIENFNVQTLGMPIKSDVPQRLAVQVNLFVLRVRQ